jgi:hypothetical protein
MATAAPAQAPAPAPEDEKEDEDEAAALPDLDHLTMRDFYDIYEASSGVRMNQAALG